MLFEEDFMYTAVARTEVQLFSLDQSFFLNKKHTIKGLEDAIFFAEAFTEEFGLPCCDFHIFDFVPLKPRGKFRRGINHMKVI